jgi:hypothetical protein
MVSSLSQPGCHMHTQVGSASGRSIVILELPLPMTNFPRMRGAIRKQQPKQSKTGRSILGRGSSFLQFDSKPVSPSFETAKDGVNAALRKFWELYKCEASSPQAASRVVKKIRIKHPRLDVNKYHSGPGHVPGAGELQKATLCYSRFVSGERTL